MKENCRNIPSNLLSQNLMSKWVCGMGRPRVFLAVIEEGSLGPARRAD